MCESIVYSKRDDVEHAKGGLVVLFYVLGFHIHTTLYNIYMYTGFPIEQKRTVCRGYYGIKDSGRSMRSHHPWEGTKLSICMYIYRWWLGDLEGELVEPWNILRCESPSLAP